MRKTICLNMIVKNEGHIIATTLNNILNYIHLDYWVISDTGSTDNTIDVIQTFFRERNIPGELVCHPWKDFGHNRTLALEVAYKKTDYIFIFDADDSFHGDFKLPELKDEWYMFEFGNQFKYVRPLLFTNHKKWKYTGVLHEYLEPLEQMPPVIILKGNYFIESGRLGDRSKNPDKYYHDALVLEKAFDTEQNSKLKFRYAFYCAQSYRDAGETYLDKSIEWYTKILDNKHQWDQERYYASLQLGVLYHKKQICDKSLHYFLKTVEFDSERVEGIVLAMQIYSQVGNHILVNALYHKFKHYTVIENKLFIETLSYKHRIEFYNSISAFFVHDSKEGYECCKKILIGPHITGNERQNTIQNIMTGYKKFAMEDTNTLDLFHSIQSAEWNTITIDLWKLLFEQNKNTFTSSSSLKVIKSTNTLISFYCNDVPEFKNTLHSMIRCCKDLNTISHWICICNSNMDFHKLKQKYSWIEFYKTTTPMNMVWEKLNNIKPTYWIHVPNCIFYQPLELKPLQTILDKNEHSIHQIIFNRNYGTMPNTIHNQCSLPTMSIALHEYKENSEPSESTYSYWPHFALQPSICLVDSILQLGKFLDTPYFEYDYALQWNTAGYKTAFYSTNTFYIPPIPRHSLVNLSCKHPHICVINLERRLDRKQKLQPIFKSQQLDPKWIKAVDGKQLMPTEELNQLVKGNMYNSRRGVIGCALSHLNLWKQLVQDSNHEYYIVLEDDISLQDGWYDKINTIQHEGQDLIWLGYHMFSHVREKVKHVYDIPDVDITVSAFENESKQYVGGTFAYIIYKSGAQKIIDFIQQNGIKWPIDNLMVNVPTLNMKEIRPFLFHSEWYEDIHKPVDSDIQMINDNLFVSDLSSLLDQFIFIPNLDQIGNDLYHFPATLPEQLTRALHDEKCIAFNTLGYFKYTLTHLSKPGVFKESDGIFLKKSRVRIQS
jgi:GR25 family glycosyltransferase involved in LPS biosynthesis/glycosyltransferase involved in cell wall biosynthesis